MAEKNQIIKGGKKKRTSSRTIHITQRKKYWFVAVLQKYVKSIEGIKLPLILSLLFSDVKYMQWTGHDLIKKKKKIAWRD